MKVIFTVFLCALSVHDLWNHVEFSSDKLLAILNRILLRKWYLMALVYLSQAHCTHLSQAQIELEKIHQMLMNESSIAQSIGIGKPIAQGKKMPF